MGTRGGWSGIMAALCSARRARRGRAARRRRRPAALTLRQKSTCSVCSACPCAATATSVRLVTRAQFSRRSARRRGQLRSRRARQSSVTWPQPDSVTDVRLGHLRGERCDSGAPGEQSPALCAPLPLSLRGFPVQGWNPAWPPPGLWGCGSRRNSCCLWFLWTCCRGARCLATAPAGQAEAPDGPWWGSAVFPWPKALTVLVLGSSVQVSTQLAGGC